MMMARFPAAGVWLALSMGFGGATPVHADSPELVPVPASRLCVTEGALASLPDARLSIEAAKLRAVLAATGPQAIEARFTYLGPTAEIAPLRSGAVRRQFGLKLRAADGCNLIYAMWRFAPEPALVVSVKSNPGVHTSRACGNAGYVTVSPRRASPVAAPDIGTTRRLTATLDGATLRVLIDGSLVWEGELGPEALAVDGPVGLRSDNVRLAVALLAPPDTTAGSCAKPNDAGED